MRLVEYYGSNKVFFEKATLLEMSTIVYAAFERWGKRLEIQFPRSIMELMSAFRTTLCLEPPQIF